MLNLSDFTSRTPSGPPYGPKRNPAQRRRGSYEKQVAHRMIGGLAPSLCASAVLRVGEYTWRFAGLSKCLGASLGGLDLGELYSKKAVVVAVIKIL